MGLKGTVVSTPQSEHSVRVSVREMPAAAGEVPLATAARPERRLLQDLQRLGSFLNCFSKKKSCSPAVKTELSVTVGTEEGAVEKLGNPSGTTSERDERRAYADSDGRIVGCRELWCGGPEEGEGLALSSPEAIRGCREVVLLAQPMRGRAGLTSVLG